MLVILFSESLNRICHLSHHQKSSVKLNNITFLASSALLVIPANSLTWMVVSSLSHVQLFVTLQTVVHQTPLSMGFSRQESWSGFPFPSPGDHPDPEIKLVSLALQADGLSLSHRGNPSQHRAATETPPELWFTEHCVLPCFPNVVAFPCI